MVERQGFEPWVRFNPYAPLARVCLQPLGHLSIKVWHMFSCKNTDKTYAQGFLVKRFARLGTLRYSLNMDRGKDD